MVGRRDLGYEEEIWDRKRDWGWKDLTDVKVWDVKRLGIPRKILNRGQDFGKRENMFEMEQIKNAKEEHM